VKFFHGSGQAAIAALGAMLSLGALRVGVVRAAQDAKSAETPSGNADNGKQLFVKNGCYECHGREGQGSIMSGPRIAPDPIPFDALLNYVRKPKGEMPPYTAKVISDKDLADIYAYLQSRKEPPTAKALPLLK
jgi:ubiquinol-cytochrome c reductase cytochrome c subunit